MVKQLLTCKFGKDFLYITNLIRRVIIKFLFFRMNHVS